MIKPWPAVAAAGYECRPIEELFSLRQSPAGFSASFFHDA